jgi:hypothetical protein
VIVGGPVAFPVPTGLGLFIGAFMEVDALSYGTDPALEAIDLAPGVLAFSVDEYATGLPSAALGVTVLSEGAAGAMEASADVFTNAFALPPGATPAIAPPPPPPASPPAGNIQILDGNGVNAITGAPTLGLALAEPNPPTPALPLPDPGDNLDALDIDTTPAELVGPVYFSLDSPFPDALEIVAGPPPNTGAAAANGFVGGDVLVCAIPDVTPPALFAPAAALGLDLTPAGPDSDDLDALILAENGTGIYEPSFVAYDWVGGATDMLLFSVRRGSAVIGLPDSLYGAPIEEGDILSTPLPLVLGGLSPFPSIFIPAEWLGLATVRSGAPAMFGDDLDALDVDLTPGFLIDCNSNGVADSLDIDPADPDGNGMVSSDCDANGVPDECDPDCNDNDVPDTCDIDPSDPDGNGLVSPDCNANGAPDECEPDCNGNGSPDDCDVDPADPDGNGLVSPDCNSNGAPDECDVWFGGSPDCNTNLVPDECDTDCNGNDLVDDCEVEDGAAPDCDHNGVPDECDPDCNASGRPDWCDLHPITFAAPAGIFLGVIPTVVRVGPIDADADADIVAGSFLTAMVLSNGGGGSFTPAGMYAFAEIRDLILADLDGDFASEIIVAHGVYGTLSIRFNSGTGTFGDAVTIPAGPGPSRLAAADLDGDADLDLVVNHFDAEAVSIYVLLNSGTGSFSAPVAVAVGDLSADVTCADLDGDLDPEVIVLVYTDEALQVVLLPNTSASGMLSFGTPLVMEIDQLMTKLEAADLDGDGDRDIFSFCGSGLLILMNTSAGSSITLADPVITPLAPGFGVIAADDLDADGDNDVVVPTGGVVVGRNTGIGSFLAEAPLGAVGSTGNVLAVADLNDDALPEIVIDSFSAGGISVFLNTSVPSSLDENGNDVPDECDAAVPGDLDGDGDVDVSDLLGLLAAWGPCPPPCPADLNRDGVVNVTDLLILLANWTA